MADDLDRLFERLVSVLAADAPGRLAVPFPAAEVYERLVPYRSNRSHLNVATHQDYEMTVLRLLAGERGYLRLEPDDVREAMQREVTATSPDTAYFRNFPDCRVMTKPHRVAVIPGDGIGPEVIEAAIPIIERAAGAHGVTLAWERLPYGADHYLKTKETLPDMAFRKLRDESDAIFLGAIGDPRVPGNEHARDILLGLRFKLDLYINFRPVRLLHPDLSALRLDGAIDFVIFRENTEGIYTGGGRIEGQTYIAEEINTAKGVERIIRAAFEWAKAHGKTRVTMSDKSNAVPAHKVWQDRFKAVAAEYPGISAEHRYVDALAMELVREPQRFQVIVTNNLYGDILSDLGAGLVGGLGFAASANLHPGRGGLFEPVHGSAPPLAGKGVANPMAAVLTGALMFEQLGHAAAARDLERAVKETLAAGIRTPDPGGSARTGDVADAIAQRLS